MKPCPVCNDVEVEPLPEDVTFDGITVTCDRCGTYSAAGSQISRLRDLQPAQRAIVSGWVREQHEGGARPFIKGDDLIDRILQFARPTLKERANRLLAHRVRNEKRMGEKFRRNFPSLRAITYVTDRVELEVVFEYLIDQKLATPLGGTGSDELRITPAGYAYMDELGLGNRTSLQGFVAMSFDKSLNDAYEKGFKEGISAAGYRPMRIDRHDHINRIDDEIIAQIRRSRFIVADFTGHRGGVYFEAGFALGLNLPVIWTCHKDDMKDLHFDIRQFNCLSWDLPDALATSLKLRIEAILGQGPLLPA